MRKSGLYAFLLMLFVMSISLTSWHCANKEGKQIAATKSEKETFSLSFDSTLVETFYAKYPKLILYKKQVVSLYQKITMILFGMIKKEEKKRLMSSSIK